MKRVFLYILLLLSFPGCEKKTDWTLKSRASKLIVVDGIITGELKTQSLTLTFPVLELNAKPVPVTGANILISDEDSLFHMTEQPAGSGVYKSVFPFLAREGRIIHCSFFMATRLFLQNQRWRLPQPLISWSVQRMMIQDCTMSPGWAVLLARVPRPCGKCFLTGRKCQAINRPTPRNAWQGCCSIRFRHWMSVRFSHLPWKRFLSLPGLGSMKQDIP